MDSKELFNKLKQNYSEMDIDVALETISTHLLDPDLLDFEREVLIQVLMYYTQIRDLSLMESMQGEKIGYGYYYTKLSNKSSKQIREYFLNNDMAVSSLPDFHLTLMYDRSNPISPFPTLPKYYIATVKDIKLMGDKTSKWHAIALELDCPDTTMAHNILRQFGGFKHSYDTFIPHMTIMYQPTKEITQFIEEHKLFFQSLILEFEGNYREPIDGN